MLVGLSADEYKKLLLSVGTHRGKRPLSPVEAAALLRKATSAGASLSECAKAVQLEGPTWVSRFLKLLDLPQDVQHLIDWGRGAGTIAFTSASEVSRLDDPVDQRRAIQVGLEHNLSSAEMRQLVQLRKRSRKPMDECVAGVLKMRPQIEIRHVFIGAVTGDPLRARLRGLSQYERDQLLEAACRKKLAGLRLSGRLGVERFTLVGGKDFGGLLAAKKEVLEQEIHEALAVELSAR